MIDIIANQFNGNKLVLGILESEEWPEDYLDGLRWRYCKDEPIPPHVRVFYTDICARILKVKPEDISSNYEETESLEFFLFCRMMKMVGYGHAKLKDSRIYPTETSKSYLFPDSIQDSTNNQR